MVSRGLSVTLRSAQPFVTIATKSTEKHGCYVTWLRYSSLCWLVVHLREDALPAIE